jgi:hypothetical protein
VGVGDIIIEHKNIPEIVIDPLTLRGETVNAVRMGDNLNAVMSFTIKGLDEGSRFLSRQWLAFL